MGAWVVWGVFAEPGGLQNTLAGKKGSAWLDKAGPPPPMRTWAMHRWLRQHAWLPCPRKLAVGLPQSASSELWQIFRSFAVL